MEELKWSLMCESFSGVMESGVRGDKNVYRAHKNAFKIPAECVSSKVWKETNWVAFPWGNLFRVFDTDDGRRSLRKRRICLLNDGFCHSHSSTQSTFNDKSERSEGFSKVSTLRGINTQFGACTLPHRHNESPSCACHCTAWGRLNDGNKCMTTKSVSCQRHQQEARDFPLFSLSHSSGMGGNTEK